MEKLPHKLWRIVWMLRIPRIGEHHKICAGEPQTPFTGGLVEHDLRTRGVKDTGLVRFVQQVPVQIVEPHCACVGPAHAAEYKGVVLSLSLRHIFESLGCVPDSLDKR